MRSIKSLEKGLKILEIIAAFPEGARVKDINEHIVGSISNLTLYIDSLVNSGFVIRSQSSGHYHISRKLFTMVKNSEQYQHILLKDAAQQAMKQLNQDLDEEVMLAVMDGYDIHFISQLPSSRRVRISNSRADIHYPPHVTAAGKAILAFLPSEFQEKYLGDALYHQFTPKSVINPNMLSRELLAVNERGYAINYGEYETEIMAVAAPIFAKQEVLGSIVVQFPTFRYSEESLTNFGQCIMQAAKNVTHQYSIQIV